MPVYQLQCPQCRHRFGGMVFAGTRVPEIWVCPQCGSDRAQLRDDCPPLPHPLENNHGTGCPCCSSSTDYFEVSPK